MTRTLWLNLRYSWQSSLEAREKLKELIKGLQRSDPPRDIKIEILVTDPATVIDEDELVIQSVKSAHQSIFEKLMEEQFHGAVSDAIHLNRYGIPTVWYGPAGRTRQEHLSTAMDGRISKT